MFCVLHVVSFALVVTFAWLFFLLFLMMLFGCDGSVLYNIACKTITENFIPLSLA